MKSTLVLFLLLTFKAHSADAINFELPSFKDGKIFKLSDHLGKKRIVMNFWASWCTSCVQELPELHALKEKYSDAVYVGINSGERKILVKKFIRRYKFNYHILLDKDKKVATLYNIEALPRTIVIGLNKKIVFDSNRPPKGL